MLWRKLFLLMIVTLLLCPAVRAEDLVHIWSGGYGNSLSDWAADVAVDDSGNFIVVGGVIGTVDFGGGPLPGGGGTDIFVVKFDAHGNHIWSRRFGGSGDQAARSIAMDPWGNCVVTGVFSGTVNFGNGVLTSSGDNDIFLVKIDQYGESVWSSRFGDSESQIGLGVAVGASGDIAATGTFSGTVNFGGTVLTSRGNGDIYLAKFDKDGNHIWSDSFGDSEHQVGKAVAVDALGNIIVGGYIIGAVDFGGGPLVSMGEGDIFLAKFDLYGNHVWSDSWGDLGYDETNDIVVDEMGSIIVVGYFNGTVDFGGGPLTSAGESDSFLAKFDMAGNHVWSNSWGGAGSESARGVALGGTGEVVVTGSLSGTADLGGGALTSAGGQDVLVAIFESTGNHIWSNRFGDEAYQHGSGVAVDNLGNVIVAGSFAGTANFGGHVFKSKGLDDIFVAKFGPASNLVSFVVTNTNDSGFGSLRQAILDANAHRSTNAIYFDIPGIGPHTIAPTSPLPEITDQVIIDGYTQPGSIIGTNGTGSGINAMPVIELNGFGAGATFTQGLYVTAGNCVIRGLIINGFRGHGIRLTTNGSNRVEGNFIGTDPTGTIAQPNSDDGVNVGEGSNGNTIGGASADMRNLLSGNEWSGVSISDGASNNVVQGNLIGTNVWGTTDVGNGFGVTVANATDNKIGGTAVNMRNVISGNDHVGVYLLALAAGNLVQGNYIGPDVSGTAAIGNWINPSIVDPPSHAGVGIRNASNNVIGGDSPGAGNLISGNHASGVAIERVRLAVPPPDWVGENLILGNFIGTDVTGSNQLGNSGSGIEINDARRNRIGGPALEARNVISGNGGYGVHVRFARAEDNIVLGNHIGTDAGALVALGNTSGGVYVSHGASGTTIEDNVISGNGDAGIRLDAPVSFGVLANKVWGNLIGTNVDGSSAVGNSGSGVEIHSVANTIGGATPQLRNIISGNGEDGIYLEGPNCGRNYIYGNYIGTDASGTSSLGNQRDGIRVENADNVFIAAPDVPAPNVISGNVDNGVFIFGSSSQQVEVRGNFIGTDVAGTAPLGNRRGVVVYSPNNVIGGTNPGDGNVISDNYYMGILLSTPEATGNRVLGNLIGTDVTGTQGLGNHSDGVVIILGSANSIGGAESGARNVISDNAFGITIQHGSGNHVLGNFIGTDATGTRELGNSLIGVQVTGFSSSNIIGGLESDSGNVISGNGGPGVILGQSSTNNAVIENFIGTAAAGNDPLGNAGDGVLIEDDASDNFIGDEVRGNTIAYNGGAGVMIESGIRNTVLSNVIHGNGELGIDLLPAGVTPNDIGDPDTGPNNLQNFPVLTTAFQLMGTYTMVIEGYLNSLPNQSYTIECFSNTVPDVSGHGEGEHRLLGSAPVNTDTNGYAYFTLSMIALGVQGSYISATATGADGTSEFSACTRLFIDVDRDGIADEVDTDPTTFSNDFSDGTTTGYIETRGGQILRIMDSDLASEGGVVIKSGAGGNSDPAIVKGCASTEIRTIGPGAEVYITCGSSRVYVAKTSVDLWFEATDGRVAEAALNAGNTLVFDPDAFTFMAPPTNVDTVVVVVDGEEFPLEPDKLLDVTPPEITITLNRDVIWPPNHKMADIIATVIVEDNVSENPTARMDTIYSDEPDNGPADGNTTNDIQDADFGTLDTHFRLRSERSGQGDGRVYTIVYRAVDEAGNTAETSVEVRVPHDQSGHALASMGFGPAGVELERAVRQFVLVIPSAEGFDATALDVAKTYVGNLGGVITPERSLEIDNDADGLKDLAVYYSTRALNVLGEWEPIGLHYTTADGVDCLVSNIFELGEPVPLVPEIEISREGSESSEDDGWRDADTPAVTNLGPAYPNPFNPSTTIPFSLDGEERVSLRIYDAQGKLVRMLKNDVMPSGHHEVVWDGRDNAGNQMATGVYFVRFIAGSCEMTKKVAMIK